MKKRERQYFHIHSDGYFQKLSKDEYFKILIKQRKWKSKKLIVSIYADEFSFNKGEDYIFMKKEWITKLLEAPKGE